MVIRDEKLDRELYRRAAEDRLDGKTPPLQRLASPLNRFAAFVVDYFVIAWPFVLLTVSPFVRDLKEALLIDDGFRAEVSGVLIGIVGLLTLLLYQTVFHWLAGATPGKFVFGLRLVPLWSERERPSFWTCLGRACFWNMQFVGLGLPFLAVLADPNRRPWHDRLANTVVVSVRRRGAVTAPTIYEVALVRSLTWMVAGIVLVAGFAVGLQLFQSAKRDYDISQQLGDSERVNCEAIDDAIDEWPPEHGEPPQRLSVAMALFATGDLDKNCLRGEISGINAALESETLVHLAKSFIYSDDQELSDQYLDEVCNIDEKSDECRLARVIEGMADEDLTSIEKQFSGLTADSRIYLSLWALRQYLRMQDYSGAAQFLTFIPDHRSLADFVVPSRAKIFWGLNRQEEARATGTAALDMLSGFEKLQFSSWMCFAELSESCAAQSVQSCKVYARLNEQLDDALSEFQPALTHIKVNECREGAEFSAMLMPGLNPEVRQYAEVVTSKDLSLMKEFWQDEETRFELKDEVAQKILLLTDKDGDLEPIRKEWLERTRGLAWERLGRKLFDRDMLAKNWPAAFAVGDRLLRNSAASDVMSGMAVAGGWKRELVEKFIVTAYHAGEVTKAREALKQIWRGDDVRQPASAGDFAEVRRLLEGGEGK